MSPHKSPQNHIVAVIPARLASTRLPGKVLLPIAGTPMLEWVYRAAVACPQLSQVLIATDSQKVAAFANAKGWPCLMTSAAITSGTDRVHAVAAAVDASIYVNIQGDEPLLRPQHIEALLRPFGNPSVEVTTLATPCPPEDAENPNVVKVVAGKNGRALYFSRSPIPYHRDGGEGRYLKHLGLYAYRKAALARFAQLPESPLESSERLEQLRLLENGIDIYVEMTEFDTIGVDTQKELLAAEKILRGRHDK